MKSSMMALNRFSPVPIAVPMVQPRKMTHVKANIIACPAIILAKRRIISAKGLVKTPNNSMAGMMGIAFRKRGTSGQKMSFQYSRLPNRLTARNVHSARKKVILILPVTLEPPGKIGSRPSKLVKKMKKNTVSR